LGKREGRSKELVEAEEDEELEDPAAEEVVMLVPTEAEGEACIEEEAAEDDPQTSADAC